MRSVIVCVVTVIMLGLTACSSNPTKAFAVDVSSYSMEYTPGQIHDYLRARGFQRVKFHDYDSGIVIYEKRSAEIDEQHFRLRTHPKILVIVRLEKKRYTFEKASPRVIVWFSETDSKNFSEFALAEYKLLLDEVTEMVGADRVEQWGSQPGGSSQL